jgi:SAM-dependent methyltransferase
LLLPTAVGSFTYFNVNYLNVTTLPTMKLNSHDLEGIAGLTLQHYDQRAEDFWEGTRGHDVSQNIAALLQYIEGKPPYAILDLGCGPGRDLKAFSELGHVAVGLEGSARFIAMARGHGYEVWEQNFLKLDLPEHRFDGVFANAVLFHVPSQELPRVLLELHASLKPRGVLFSSTRTAITRKAGTTGATVHITISKSGAASCRLRDSLN